MYLLCISLGLLLNVTVLYTYLLVFLVYVNQLQLYLLAFDLPRIVTNPAFMLQMQEETRHEMRIPEPDVTYIVFLICLLTYAYPQIATELEPVPLRIKWIMLKLT